MSQIRVTVSGEITYGFEGERINAAGQKTQTTDSHSLVLEDVVVEITLTPTERPTPLSEVFGKLLEEAFANQEKASEGLDEPVPFTPAEPTRPAF